MDMAIEDSTAWQPFRASQKEIILDAGVAAHISVKIRYIDEGEARHGVVLLMHGIPTWGYLYHSVIPRLVCAGYRVIAPDFLGHGWSDRRDRFDRSFQDQSRMILGLLSALGLERVDVVGHDTGGAVALILAIEHSATVRRLVISDSVCYDRFDDDMLDFGHPLRWKQRTIGELVEALEGSLKAGLSNKDKLTDTFREGIIAPWASEEGKLSLLRNASALNPNQTMALVDRHQNIKAPTLVIWGEDDPWQSPDDGRRLSSEIPNSTFQLISGASHWLPHDAPEQFSDFLLEFFAKHHNT